MGIGSAFPPTLLHYVSCSLHIHNLQPANPQLMWHLNILDEDNNNLAIASSHALFALSNRLLNDLLTDLLPASGLVEMTAVMGKS